MAILPQHPSMRHRGRPVCDILARPYTEGELARKNRANRLDVRLSFEELVYIVRAISCHGDYSGIAIMAGSTVSILLAITWGGIQFPWSSAHVLVPLIIGAVGLLVFFALEFFWLKGPTVCDFSAIFDVRLMIHGRSLAFSSQIAQLSVGKCIYASATLMFVEYFHRYIGTFFHGIVALAVICMRFLFSIADSDSSTHSDIRLPPCVLPSVAGRVGHPFERLWLCAVSDDLPLRHPHWVVSTDHQPLPPAKLLRVDVHRRGLRSAVYP